MSTHVTVSVAAPNHLPVKVHTESKSGAQWVTSDTKDVRVDGAKVFLVHGTQRLVIEEQSAS